MSAAVFGQMPRGSTFSVLAGPVCADGYNGWQVSHNGRIGWTAEGQGDKYWLAPLS